VPIEEDDPRFELALARAFEGLGLHAAPQPAYAAANASRLKRTPLAALGGVPALIGTKAFAAAAVVTLAGTAVGVKAAVTGNANPTNWGQTVTQQVTACKSQLPADQHGIGPCVSPVANQHGQQESTTHSQAGAHSSKNPAGGPPTNPGKPSFHGPPTSPPRASPAAGHSGSHPTH